MLGRASNLLKVSKSRALTQFGQKAKQNNIPPNNAGSKNSRTGLFGVLGALSVGTALTVGVASASGDDLHAPHYPWNHQGKFSAFDTASLRRGFEVYRQVCSTCHSMQFLCYRNLVGVTHTEEQAKAIANSVEVTAGPNDEGEMFKRPGILSDRFVSPYPNEEYARFVNGGALPPDLSLMRKARGQGEDYIMALLTGYCDPPAGVVVREGLAYNPYFPGGAIGMPKPLNDGQIQYEDGTPSSTSQMSKDVSVFLSWAASPEQDQRKKLGTKYLAAMATLIGLIGYYKRFKWSIYKTRKIEYRNF